MEKNTTLKNETEAKNTVLKFLHSLNKEDFDASRSLLKDDFEFNGVMGFRSGADAYLADMKKMKLKYDIRKVLADETDVAVFYDIGMSGKNIFCCGWYHVEEGLIATFRVVFDPRPILETTR